MGPWPPRAWPLGLLILGILGGLAVYLRFEVDDAYISFRYARNWAEGLGLRYNPGVDPPVEGYSNFLWVAALALGARVGLAPPVGACLLSSASAAALAILVARVLRQRGQARSGATLVALLVLATSPCFAAWTTSGLETMPAALLVFLGWRLVTRPTGATEGEPSTGMVALLGVALAGAALALVRVEGPLWALGLAGLAAVDPTLVGRRPTRRILGFGAGALVATAAYLAYRKLHFDAWISNTAVNKGGITPDRIARGARQTATFFLLSVTPALAILALPFALLRSGPGERAMPGLGTALGAAVGALAYATLVGGDWMPFFRFHVASLPFLALILGLAHRRLPPWTLGLTVVACAVGVLPAFDRHLVPESLRTDLDFRAWRTGYETEVHRLEIIRNNTRKRLEVGRALAEVSEPGDSVVTRAIGCLGYASRLFVHDCNGLVDRDVARMDGSLGTATAGHERTVPWSHFLGAEPTWFFPGVFGFEAGGGAEAFRIEARRKAQAPRGDLGLLGHVAPYWEPLERGQEGGGARGFIALRRTDAVSAQRAWFEVFGGMPPWTR